MVLEGTWALTYRKEHVGHVLLYSFPIGDSLLGFTDTGTFAREDGLVDSEATGRH